MLSYWLPKSNLYYDTPLDFSVFRVAGTERQDTETPCLYVYRALVNKNPDIRWYRFLYNGEAYALRRRIRVEQLKAARLHEVMVHPGSGVLSPHTLADLGTAKSIEAGYEGSRLD